MRTNNFINSLYRNLSFIVMLCCISVSVSQAQIVCGDNVRIETIARGLLDDNDNCVGVSAADMVGTHVEVWIEDLDCGGNLPNSIQITAGGQTVTANGVMAQQTSSSSIEEYLYRAYIPGRYNQVCVSNLSGCRDATSMALYVERSQENSASTLIQFDQEFHLNGCIGRNVLLDEADANRDFSVMVPIHEKADDGREVRLVVEARNGNTVLNTVDQTFTAQNAGMEASLFTLNITAASNADRLRVFVCSPASNGDSFGAGSVAVSTTECPPPCDLDISINPDINPEVCLGQIVNITPVVSGGIGNCNIQWERRVGTSGPWLNTNNGTADLGFLTAAGLYQYRAIYSCNTAGCDPVTSNVVTIEVLALPPVTASSTNETCEEENGTITFQFSDTQGRTLLDFSIDGGNTYPFESIPDNSGSFTVSDLAPGTYELYARWGDTACPISLGNETINSQAAPNVTAVTNTDETCEEENGTITFTFPENPDNRGIIEFSIDGGTTYPFESDADAGTFTISGLAPSTYEIYVRWGNTACPLPLQNVTIDPDPAPPVTNIVSTDEICEGEDGTITISFDDTAGRTLLDFSLDGGSSYPFESIPDNSGSFTISDLAPGSYDLYVRWGDADCPTELETIVIDPQSLPEAMATANAGNMNCAGQDVTLQATGAGAGGSYLWDNGLGAGATQTVSPLSETTYTVTVTDANGCTDTESVTVEVVPCGSIGSIIWSDDNDNGIRDANELTLGEKGKTVTLELLDANTGQILATTTSTPSGEYVFDNLFPGDYIVQFLAPDSNPVSSTTDFANDDQSDDNDNGIQQDTNGDGRTDGLVQSNVVTLTPAGEPTGDSGLEQSPDNFGDNTIDFGLIPLVSVGSTVFFDDNNNGVQDPGEDGLDAKGKSVTLELVDATTGQVVATTTTTQDGSYLFDNLLPGDYFIQFEAPESAPLSSTTDFDADDQVDGNDNGTQQDTDGDGLTDGLITSNVFNLTPDAEPTSEPGTNGGKDSADDNNGDMTIDFGLVRLMAIGNVVFSDDNNNGVQDPGEENVGQKGKTIEVSLLDANGNLLATTTFDGLLPGDYIVQIVPPESLPVSSTPTNTNDCRW